MRSTVPALIHQIWLGDKEPPLKLIRSWRLLHPNFKYIVWTDEKVKTLKLHNRKIFDWLKSPTMKADLLRYEILYQLGGVYVDVDILCLRPIVDLLKHHFFVAQDNYWWERKGYIANGFMGCSPHHPLTGLLVNNFKNIELKSKSGHGALTTGPKYLTKMWRDSNINIHVLPKEQYMLEAHTCNFDTAVTIHVNQSHPENKRYYEAL